MNTKTINDIFTNHSGSGKWIIDQYRDLVQIPNTEVPVQYHPETGECLGVLCEPPSKNYYPTAMDMSSGLATTNGVYLSNTVGGNSILFFPQGMFFDGSVKDRFESKQMTFTLESPKNWFYVGVSFFVRFPNGGPRPVYGRSYMEDTDFHVMLNGLEGIEAGGDIDIHQMNDGCYWVKTRIKTPSRPVYEVSIGNGYWQSDRDFIVSGLQIEPYMNTSPILTDGMAEEREGNYVEFSASANRTINPQQGTIELGYELNHGSVGSALYAFSATQSWEIGHVGEWQDNHENEPLSYEIKVESSSEGYDFFYAGDIEPFTLKKWKTPHRVRMTFSPFGHRFTMNDSLVYKSKDFNYNENMDVPMTFRLGVSENGENINGHIHYFNIIARALTDEEMIHV